MTLHVSDSTDRLVERLVQWTVFKTRFFPWDIFPALRICSALHLEFIFMLLIFVHGVKQAVVMCVCVCVCSVVFHTREPFLPLTLWLAGIAQCQI